MFAFGKKGNEINKCWCETEAAEDGTCELSNTNEYRLYKYSGKSITNDLQTPPIYFAL